MNHGPSDRPFVIINVAMTADGKIATANQAIRSFGSPRDHARLLELRATADAVLCGARTAGVEGVTLDPGGPSYQRRRIKRGLAPANLRVVVTGSASLPPDSTLFTRGEGPVILIVSGKAPADRVERLRELADEVFVCGDDSVDLAGALRWLRSRHQTRRLICEGGAELNDAMIRANLVDEIRVTLCPRIVGGRAAPTLSEGVGVPSLAEARRLKLHAVTREGDELFLVYRVVHPLTGPPP
jgi:2,5-diamino-6-(ribosylamino)-4(3H)-pyrimidinone 5'-phosphate reductase